MQALTKRGKTAGETYYPWIGNVQVTPKKTAEMLIKTTPITASLFNMRGLRTKNGAAGMIPPHRVTTKGD